jgi:hypothetical protein
MNIKGPDGFASAFRNLLKGGFAGIDIYTSGKLILPKNGRRWVKAGKFQTSYPLCGDSV